jgi:hypothetical protein
MAKESDVKKRNGQNHYQPKDKNMTLGLSNRLSVYVDE